MQLSDMKSWNIKQVSVSGSSGTDWTPANGFNASVVYPDMDSVKKAVVMIQSMHSEDSEIK